MSINKITITKKQDNGESEITRLITDKSQLANIQTTWCDFEKVKFPSDADWTHGLKIEGGDREGIWLYNEKGYLSRLNYQLKPSFHIMNPEEFNRLLGI
jgi:hypothetical protein